MCLMISLPVNVGHSCMVTRKRVCIEICFHVTMRILLIVSHFVTHYDVVSWHGLLYYLCFFFTYTYIHE
jgi:hypothetical protein